MLKCNIKVYFFFIVCAFKIECNRTNLAEKTNDGSNKPLEIQPVDKNKNKNELGPNGDKQIKEEILKDLEAQPEDKPDPSVDKQVKEKEVVKNPSKEESLNPSSTKLNHQETSTPLYKPVLVTLHGLNMDADEEDAIKEAVEQKFGKAVEVIQPKCREGWTSAHLSIDAQAEKVVEEIKTTLRNSYPQYSEEALKAIPINIFGYSQGGLVACIIAANYHNKELYINSLTLCHAPLSGTDVLENTQSDINEFNKKAKPGLEAIGYNTKSLTAIGENLERKIAVSALNGWLSGLGHKLQGVTDMRINSDICKRIKKFLREEKHGIPTLIIAGCINSLTKYFKFLEQNKEHVNVLNQQYAKLTTGKEDGEHDILIPIKRQLCRTNSFKNIAKSENDPVYPENVEIHTDHALHCYNLMSMGSDYRIHHVQRDYERMFFRYSAHIDNYINFLEKHNNLNRD